MSLQQLRAYIAYLCKARHHNGHGIHSPFVYELARSVLFAKRRRHEPYDRYERVRERLDTFCNVKDLQLIYRVSNYNIERYTENTIAMLEQPYANHLLWNFLAENENTTVTIDCWKFGLALAVPHLQKQGYVVRL